MAGAEGESDICDLQTQFLFCLAVRVLIPTEQGGFSGVTGFRNVGVYMKNICGMRRCSMALLLCCWPTDLPNRLHYSWLYVSTAFETGSKRV